MIGPIKERVKTMEPEVAGKILSCSEDEVEFHERLQIIMRAHNDKDFELKLVSFYKPGQE